MGGDICKIGKANRRGGWLRIFISLNIIIDFVTVYSVPYLLKVFNYLQYNYCLSFLQTLFLLHNKSEYWKHYQYNWQHEM